MGKVEATLRSEIMRLARREMRKATVPLTRDVRSLKATVSQLRRGVSALERLTARQNQQRMSEKVTLETPPEQLEKSRFSPRLIRGLRKRLGITQKELAALAGVTVGAIFQWEKGIFDPRDDKKGILVALRKLGRREVRKVLEEKKDEITQEKSASGPKTRRRRQKKVQKPSRA
jgi:DNA-binding transcriptional regulator YiaG